MRTEHRDAPEIIGRLHGHAQTQLEGPRASRLARPLGWLLVLAIVGAIIVIATTANPW